jgi:glycerophosphoryl diester phosphodiesterase
LVGRRFIERAHAHNIQVHAWTINEADTMRRLIDLGVDGLITDYPDRLLKILQRLPEKEGQ